MSAARNRVVHLTSLAIAERKGRILGLATAVGKMRDRGTAVHSPKDPVIVGRSSP